MIATQPAVGLLCDGRVKVPLFVTFTSKLRKCDWVAVGLAKSVCDGMLALEMEDINRKPDTVEIGVIPYNLCKLAVIVEENMVRHCSGYSKRPLDHLLVDGNIRIPLIINSVE